MAFSWFEMDFFSFETNSDQQVGSPFIGPGQEYRHTISNSGQSENPGMVGGGIWGGSALLFETGLTGMSKSWGALVPIVPPTTPPTPALTVLVHLNFLQASTKTKANHTCL